MFFLAFILNPKNLKTNIDLLKEECGNENNHIKINTGV